MSAPINIHDAKTHFSKLIDRVEHGEEVLISRAGRLIAKLVPAKSVPASPAKHAQAAEPMRDSSDLADVQATPGAFAALDWVGMANIAVPVRLDSAVVTARADIAVNLHDPTARGIHMSRLYLALDDGLSSQPLSAALLSQLLQTALSSHAGLSTRAKLSLRFELMLRRPALASAHSGWRAYPATVHAQADTNGGFSLQLGVQIAYSSTCPCSAALARGILQERFASEFSGHDQALSRAQVSAWLGSPAGGSAATPHSQRSTLDVQIGLIANDTQPLPWLELIDTLENALQTPVQTAVKRVDEQAFAVRNGGNLMFVEDALRRVQQALAALPFVASYTANVAHLESLHAHDAVAAHRQGL
jgi:GTP cyclohydrolase IB